MELDAVQKHLMRTYPQFKSKQDLIRYYVGFQFPQKQQTIAIWWKQKIIAVLKYLQVVYVPPSKLKVIFSFHGLKPIPLETLLEFYNEKGQIYWRQKPVHNQNFFSNMMNYFWTSKNKQSILDDDFSKITFRSYHSEVAKGSLQIIQEFQKSRGHLFEYKDVEAGIKQKLKLVQKSIQIVLNELKEDGKILIEVIGSQKFVLYSKFSSEMTKQVWVQVEKNKHLLNQKIQQFSSKLKAVEIEELKLTELARNQLQKGTSKEKVKNSYILPAKQRQKKAQALRIRKKILQDTLIKLETQEIDNITIDLMITCQDVLTKNMKDVSEVQEIYVKNEQTKQKQEQINENMKQFVEEADISQVDDLLKELEGEVALDKKKSIGKKSIQVNLRPSDQLDVEQISKKESQNKDIDFMQA